MNRAAYSQNESWEIVTNRRTGVLIVTAMVAVTLLLTLYSVYNIYLNI